MNATEIDSKLAELGLTVESEFVPFSKSRNSEEKDPSLNWKVTLKHNERPILTTDYMAGMGHCPFYKKIKFPYKLTVWQMAEIRRECETGYPVTKAEIDSSLGAAQQNRKAPILPDTKDVIYSLLMDSEVLNYASFEEWAGEFGYDEDSRKGEKLYNDCMKIALQFRQIGESNISALREIFQDY